MTALRTPDGQYARDAERLLVRCTDPFCHRCERTMSLVRAVVTQRLQRTVWRCPTCRRERVEDRR